MKEGTMLSNILELRTKMITGFVLVALITAVVGMIALRSMSMMAQADQRLYEDATVPLPELSNIGTSFEKRQLLAARGLQNGFAWYYSFSPLVRGLHDDPRTELSAAPEWAEKLFR